MILTLNREHITQLNFLAERNNDPKDPDYWPTCFQQQDEGVRTILGWIEGEQIIAYVQLNRAPKYQPFESTGIPEIQDLRVDRDYRHKGIGTSLIYFCEAIIVSEGGTMMGIGVGLYSDYGKAQQLYVSLGYVPDGAGINYDRVTVKRGERVIVDDDLSLMMVKSLT
jgi:GNAT superfamily N-acetyltransferase